MWLSGRLQSGIPVKKLGKASFLRHIPKAYEEAAKGHVAHRRLDNRFGAPPRTLWKSNPEEYEPTPWRPWEREAQSHQSERAFRERKSGRRKDRRFVPNPPRPIPDEEWLFFLGDYVQITVGKDKGKIGVVKAITRETNSVFVEGLNTGTEVWGGAQMKGMPETLVRREEPLDAGRGEVVLVDEKTERPWDAEWREDGAGMAFRVDRRSGATIPIPQASAGRAYEYMSPNAYVPDPDKDTRGPEAFKRSYQPSLLSFEQEVAQECGVHLPSHQPKTYFY